VAVPLHGPVICWQPLSDSFAGKLCAQLASLAVLECVDKTSLMQAARPLVPSAIATLFHSARCLLVFERLV